MLFCRFSCFILQNLMGFPAIASLIPYFYSMFWKSGGVRTAFFLCTAIFIHFFSFDPQRVERYYSTRFYEQLSSVFRAATGWLPFSIGDILYVAAVTYIIYRVIKKVGGFRRGSREFTWRGTMRRSVSYINTLLLFYIFFNLVWGLNYNRSTVADKIGLDIRPYSFAELEEVSCVLIDKVNYYRERLPATYPDDRQLFKKVSGAYRIAEMKYPFMKLGHPSSKPSLFTVIGSYAGFTGYYNPFTGEAQVCTSYPKFLLPYTACHEVAHQLGFAKENEANFVGYLAAANSNDPLLQYSVYLDLFIYANRSLSRIDTTLGRVHRRSLSKKVHGHLEEWYAFAARHRNPVEPYFRLLYGKFLERNQQPRGMLTYDEVTGFIIALYKRDGAL